MSRKGYRIVIRLIREFGDRPFTPQEVNAKLGYVSGPVYFALRNGGILQTTNGKKRRNHSRAGVREAYQFTDSFLNYIRTDHGREYFGLNQPEGAEA